MPITNPPVCSRLPKHSCHTLEYDSQYSLVWQVGLWDEYLPQCYYDFCWQSIDRSILASLNALMNSVKRVSTSQYSPYSRVCQISRVLAQYTFPYFPALKWKINPFLYIAEYADFKYQCAKYVECTESLTLGSLSRGGVWSVCSRIQTYLSILRKRKLQTRWGIHWVDIWMWIAATTIRVCTL